jgi:ABC-type phosphate/phosphonate transport system ATPase subunit
MPKDVNQIAHSIVQQITASEKNPAAVALGRLGGLKGGKARAEKLSPEKRKAIARNAAKSRWKKKS